MSDAAFQSFQSELSRLVEVFDKNLSSFKSRDYDEASLRQEFLNPLFRALGWDIENQAGRIPKHREVEIESRTSIGGRQKRADYLFRTDTHDRFVCEAKKPAETLHARYAFQAKRYAWNKDLPLAVLTDFEEVKIYVVGGRPYLDEPDAGLWKTWQFRQLPAVAQELWELLARDRVAAGSIDRLLETLPKKPAGKGRARQAWLIKPDRTRALDNEFLGFLDEARRELASDLLNHNDRADLLEGTRLNEAVQRIIDRLLFLRICEDRDIDTGKQLNSLVGIWRRSSEPDAGRRGQQQPLELHDEPPAHYGGSGLKAPRDSLWHAVVRHFRALDRRPPSHVPFFNGNLFKPHFSEELIVGDAWLAGFIDELSAEESPYLFSQIPVEILGTIYERFLGKIVRPHGRGAVIEEKPEVRKAGGVYYTPRYIVDYVVEQTVGRLLGEISGMASPLASISPANAPGAASVASPPTEGGARRFRDFSGRVEKLRLLDPACGSGSFLIRAYERVCEEWQRWLTSHPEDRKPKLCWVDRETGDVHLTVGLKREILQDNIYGVDLDAGAVEVTQFSLYLKMLEGENRTTLQRQRELFADEVALLPPLQDNIKCGNSLIASDFSLVPDDLVRVRAFDWPVQFPAIMKAGGFDAVIGNPPYIRIQRIDHEESDYLFRTYRAPTSKIDLSLVFLEKSLTLVKSTGLSGFICTSQWLTTDYGRNLRGMLADGRLCELVDFGSLPVFETASTYPAVLILSPTPAVVLQYRRITELGQLSLAGVLSAPGKEVALDSLSEAPWNLNTFDLTALLHRSQLAFQPLSSFGGAYIGCKTGLNAAFVLTREDASAKGIEPGVSFPYALRGEEIARYQRAEPGFIVIYPYHEGPNGTPELISEPELRRKYPKAYAHLLAQRSELRKRQDSRRSYAEGAEWYRHLRPGNFRYIRQEKLVFKAISREMAGGLLAGDTAFDGANCPAILLENLAHHDPRYFLGLLNSRLISTHLRGVCPPKLSGYVKFTAKGLSAVPIRVLKLSDSTQRGRHDKLVALVEKMLGLMPRLRAAKADSARETLQNAVDATDRQIDELVYELYGLSAEEIALVEGQA